MRVAIMILLVACSSGPPAPPTGAPSDPVATCTRLADVCRLDGSRLGVCSAATACPGPAPCFVCMAQH